MWNQATVTCMEDPEVEEIASHRWDPRTTAAVELVGGCWGWLSARQTCTVAVQGDTVRFQRRRLGEHLGSQSPPLQSRSTSNRARIVPPNAYDGPYLHWQSPWTHHLELSCKHRGDPRYKQTPDLEDVRRK